MELVFILVDVQKGKRNKINRRTIPNVPIKKRVLNMRALS